MTTASGSSVSLGCFLGIGGDNKEKAGQGGKKEMWRRRGVRNVGTAPVTASVF